MVSLLFLSAATAGACAHGHQHGHQHGHDHTHGHQMGDHSHGSTGEQATERCYAGLKHHGLRAAARPAKRLDPAALVRTGLEIHAAVLREGPRRHGAAHGAVEGAHGKHNHPHPQAVRHAHGGRMGEVEACANAALAIAGDYTPALYLKGLSRLDEHHFEDAINFAERVHAADPDHVGAWLLEGDAQLELARIDAAVAAVERALALKPDAASLVRAAHLHHLLGDNAAAKRLYAQVIRDGMRSSQADMVSWAATESAKLFLGEGDAPGAEAGFEFALRFSPGAWEALLGRAEACLKQGKRACALAAARQASARWREPLPAELHALLAHHAQPRVEACAVPDDCR